MSLVPLRVAVKRTGLHPNTLRKYAEPGRIYSIRNAANQRLFDVDSFIYESKPKTEYQICYCRVSSTKQRDDLDRQVAYMVSLFPKAEIIKDIGAGLNFKRKGLKTLLERLMRRDQFTLVVAYLSRLARFGFELIEWMVEQNGGKIVVLDNTVHRPDSELTADILSIIHVFSCRMHGLRKSGQKIKQDPDLSKWDAKKSD
ncbi:IS607 family transposase [[Phormidium] sp. ETS-05]|uniref:IS607 family transposase n=1 Tax=[Phormidium] sp. ETS-05 TaxID=222819 RepID=UPI0018EEDFB3|nr:IS607 family transposase [[Phormidium] sp. ETS-05]